MSESAALILPVHQAVDAAREALRGEQKIGTTGRGIGPAYEDKVARRAVRLCDLASESSLADKLDALVAHHNIWLVAAGQPEANAKAIYADLLAMREQLLAFAGRLALLAAAKSLTITFCLRAHKASCLILTMAPIHLSLQAIP